MEKHSERQMLAWHEWIKEDYNRPSRSDYYVIQLTVAVKELCERVRTLFKGGELKIPEIDKFVLKLKEEDKRDAKTTALNARNAWLGRMAGAGIKEFQEERISKAEARRRGMID